MSPNKVRPPQRRRPQHMQRAQTVTAATCPNRRAGKQTARRVSAHRTTAQSIEHGVPGRRPNRRCADVGTTPIVPTWRLCRPEDWIACGVRNPLRVGRHYPFGRLMPLVAPSGDEGPEPGARTTVATGRITSWFAVYTGGFESAVAAPALECAGPGPPATRDRRPVGPGQRVVIVPTCRRRSPCQSADSVARSAQSRGRHNRRSRATPKAARPQRPLTLRDCRDLGWWPPPGKF